eukprot:319001_1
MVSTEYKSITQFVCNYMRKQCLIMNILLLIGYQFMHMITIPLSINTNNFDTNINTNINNNNTLLEISLAKQNKYGMVIIQLLNSGYVEMTKSWLCNVNQISTKVIPRLILITTDENAQNELKKFKINSGINYDMVFHPFQSNTNLKYGDYEYFKIELERLKLQNSLIQAGITIFMTESDSTWFTNGDLVINEFDKLL